MTLPGALRAAFVILACSASAQEASAQGRAVTENFAVEAPTNELAREFGELAEGYRKSKAVEWLGREMPRWKTRCPLIVKPKPGGAGGATSFYYNTDDKGGYRVESMEISGDVERMMHSVLPHEVTHTVFAEHFRRPVPRWADEGGSVYSEDERERARHDRMCREFLNDNRGFELSGLFALTNYPRDVMVLYAEGYSVSSFLITQKGREAFLKFVGTGMESGWNEACRQHGYGSVSELQKSWLAHLRTGKSMAPRDPEGLASAREPRPAVVAASRTRTPATPRVDLGPPQSARGSAPESDRAPAASTHLGWTPPAVDLGEPVSLTSSPKSPAPVKAAALGLDDEPTPQARPALIAKPQQPNAPPPVILFPPEPLGRE